MKKKDPKKSIIGKQGKIQKKEKKQKDPKEYIPPNLLPELRPTKLITPPNNLHQKSDSEDEAEKNYSPDYKPEFIPCKIPEEWQNSIEEEINNEFIQYEKEQEEIKEQEMSQDLKKTSTQKKEKENINKKKEENKEEKVEEEEEDQIEVDPEIIKKLNHIMKFEDDSDRFIDPDDKTLKDNLPLYLIDILHNEIKWKRPKKYIMHHFLWEKVRIVFPKKKMSVICEEIIETYKDYLLKIINGEIIDLDDEEQNLNEYLSDKNASIKNRIYKEFFPIIDQDYNIIISNSIQRLENEAEYHKRIEMENNINIDDKTKKNKKPPVKKKETNEEKIMINDMKPSSLKLNTNSNNANSFYTWMTSIYQFILDNNITDINTKRSILFNIYPQKDGIPIYNPKGKYIIKLYLMGKERKVTIDDTMPFTNDDEFVFPGCEDIREIWPSLFTKALLKLNIYKYRHPYYYKNEEFNDISFIYNLTGKYVFSFPLYDQQINGLLIQEYNENVIEFNNKYIFGFYKTTKTKSMKITQIYQSYDERITELNNRLREKEKNKHLIPLIQSINSGLNPSKKSKPKLKFNEDILNFGKKNNNFSLNKIEDMSGFKRRTKKFGTLSLNDPRKVMNTLRIQNENLIDGDVVKNYLYTINDYFESKKYNMLRTKKISFNDLEMENEETKWEFKQLNINEKKDYMIRRRDLKKKHKEERIKRIEALKISPENNEFKLFKINSNCENLPSNYKGFDFFNDKEITMGRKCLANGWGYPPVEFFTFDKMPDPPVNENEMKLNKRNNEEMMKYRKIKKTMALYGWTVDNFKELCEKDFIEEKNLDENNIIKARNSSDKKGIWFENKKINQLFDTILVVFNEDNLYKSNLLCDNGYYNYLTDVYEPIEEYQAFYLINEKLQNEREAALNEQNKPKNKNNKLDINNNQSNQNNSITNNISSNINENFGINIVFQPYIEQLYMHPQPKVYLMPYINLDIYDCENQRKIFSKITLNHFYSSFYSDKFDNNGEYYIIITDGYYPCGYTLNIASNGFCVKNMTRNKFYQQILNYKTKIFNLDFPALEKDKLWLFGKILITNSSQNKSTIRFKFNINYKIKQILPFIKVFLENQNINEKKREIQLDEFVTLEQENTAEIQSKDYITILIKPEYLLKSSSIDVEILYDNEEFNFELLDLVSPYEIIGDTFESNNNGLIFSEYIYPSENEVVSFLDLSIRHIENDTEKLIEGGEIDFKLELYELLNEPNINFEENSIHFSYSNLGKLLKSWTFYNDINLSNIVFNIRKALPKEEENGDVKNNDKKKKQPSGGKIKEIILPYILICYVKDRFNNRFKFENIKWKIRIFSDNVISFVKDLSKISHEDKIKTEWELNQPGRKIIASDSRKKFLVYKKNEKGETLSKEEKDILNKERPRGSEIEKEKEEKELKEKEEEKNKKNKKSRNTNNKKENNKNVNNKENNNNTNMESKTVMYTKINKLPIIHSRYLLDTEQFKMNHILKNIKKVNNVRSLFISNYINYINQQRVIKYQGLQKNISVINDEFLEKYNQKILNDFEQSQSVIKKENYFVKSQSDKNDADDNNFNIFLNKFGRVRLKASDSMKNLMVKRNVLNKCIIDKINIEKKINEIFDFFKSRDNSLITNEKNEKNEKKNKNKNAKNDTANKNDIDINEMTNVYEKAKELLNKDDKRLDELAHLIEMKKEELATKLSNKTSNSNKAKKKKK